MGRLARRGLAWLATWLALFWLWMLLVGEWNEIELFAAAVAATLAATAAEAVRAFAGMRYRIPFRLLGAVPTALAMVVVDFGIVVGALVGSLVRGRVPRGRFVVRPFDAGGDDPEAFGKRAWVTLVATISPNAYVVDIDREEDTVLLHDLVPFRKSEEPV